MNVVDILSVTNVNRDILFWEAGRDSSFPLIDSLESKRRLNVSASPVIGSAQRSSRLELLSRRARAPGTATHRDDDQAQPFKCNCIRRRTARAFMICHVVNPT